MLAHSIDLPDLGHLLGTFSLEVDYLVKWFKGRIVDEYLIRLRRFCRKSSSGRLTVLGIHRFLAIAGPNNMWQYRHPSWAGDKQRIVDKRRQSAESGGLVQGRHYIVCCQRCQPSGDKFKHGLNVSAAI